jgi:hypothetical protein
MQQKFVPICVVKTLVEVRCFDWVITFHLDLLSPSASSSRGILYYQCLEVSIIKRNVRLQV